MGKPLKDKYKFNTNISKSVLDKKGVYFRKEDIKSAIINEDATILKIKRVYFIRMAPFLKVTFTTYLFSYKE